jgi:hypothetical protein
VPCLWFKNWCVLYIYMQQSLSWKLTGSQLVKKFPALCHPTVYCCIYKCVPPVPVLSGVPVAFGKLGPRRSRLLILSIIISFWYTFLFSLMKIKSYGLFMRGSFHIGNKSHPYSTWNYAVNWLIILLQNLTSW